MKKIGVTGTRYGMNGKQKENIFSFLAKMKKENEAIQLHHGDCAGVDVEVAAIAKELGFRIVSHPPIDNDCVKFPADEIREPLGHFARNRSIVDETDLLIVVPLQNSHQTQGGTWYTHDYAVKKKKPVEIFFPGE